MKLADYGMLSVWLLVVSACGWHAVITACRIAWIFFRAAL